MTVTKTRVNTLRRLSSKTFLTEPPKSNLKHSDKIANDLEKQNKVCFAERLETVHEIPYKQIFSKADFRNLKLPLLPVNKYVPLIVCDPFARPSKKKKVDNPNDDSLKLPILDPYGITFGFCAKPQAGKRDTNVVKKQPAPVSTQHKSSNDKTDKLQLANTVHFRYSDFILRKMDAISFDRPKS
ncbi:hypothetical protein AC249_AIPGENE16676 [Exaiptasia diaphana]|nr:hypothetical protein AC249_AIPGENE16676 [Exaiptasia diaphana]